MAPAELKGIEMLSLGKKIVKQGLGRQGLSVVEMALVIPLFLIMIFGIIETSNLFRTWLTLQKAAQAGARYAATGESIPPDSIARTRPAVPTGSPC